MTTWHRLRRIIAAAVAAIVTKIAHNHGFPILGAVFLGIAAAVLTVSIIIPALSKPPDDDSSGD